MNTEWQPTMNLRFRLEWESDERRSRILQQQWRREVTDDYDTTIQTEWRDVPLDREAA